MVTAPARPFHLSALARRVYDLSQKNRPVIERSTICGCFHCRAIFPPAMVHSYTGGGRTAECPECGMDAVLGDAGGVDVCIDLLAEMQLEWYL